ncbi:MAG: tetratricopeptide repeat protein [Candidatus Hydrogenedentota bacterium]|nr:MAG: tetratricopeptide repeat protein [Candidatus Hydrogenedentota bacterium]
MKGLTIAMGFIILFVGSSLLFLNQEIFQKNGEALAMLRKGKIYIEQETPEAVKKALSQFADVVAKFPNSQAAKEALFYIGEAYEKLGMRDLALAKYRSLLSQELSEKQKKLVKFKIAKLDILRHYSEEGVSSLLNLLTNTTDPKLRSEIYYELGKYYAKQGNYVKAVKNLRIALTENPQNRAALLELAKAYKKQGKDEESFHIYEEYLSLAGAIDTNQSKISQEYAGSILKKGLAAIASKNYPEAKRLFHKLIEKFPTSKEAEEARYYLGNLELESGNLKEAIRYFNQVIEKMPNIKDASAYLKKGEALYKLEEYPRAAAVFQFVIDHYPNTQYAKLAKEWQQEVENAIAENSSLISEENNSKTENTEPQAKQNNSESIDEVIEEPHLEDGETISP